MSPILWLIVINKILVLLEPKEVKNVPYADHVIVMVSGEFFDIMSDIISKALG